MHVIFDIDGTLIESLDYDTNLFFEHIETSLEIEGVCRDITGYPEVTDSSIVSQIMNNYHKRSPTAGELSHLEKGYGEKLAEKLDGKKSFVAKKGAVDFIERLENKGISISVATGNWRASAQIKLEAVGLERLMKHAGTASEAVKRSDIIEHVMKHDRTKTWYVGDGHWDLKSADQLGINFLGVGDMIKRHRPLHWVRDFNDPNLPEF